MDTYIFALCVRRKGEGPDEIGRGPCLINGVCWALEVRVRGVGPRISINHGATGGREGMYVHEEVVTKMMGV